MEIFKYVTAAHYKHIVACGSLDPRPTDGRTYGLPEDPLLWGEYIQEVLNHLMKFRGVSPIVLLKFIIDDQDPNAFVQEGDDPVWMKMDTRKPLRNYRRMDYRLPEVIISRPIPLDAISIVDSISLKNV